MGLFQAKKQQRGGYQKPTTKKEERKEREAPKSPDDAKTVKQLLGELYGDKEYLEKLLKDQSKKQIYKHFYLRTPDITSSFLLYSELCLKQGSEGVRNGYYR